MQKRAIIVIVIVIVIVFFFVLNREDENDIPKELQTISTAMKISSPAFAHNGAIPKKYTCDGENVNPELRIEGVPGNTKSLVLIMDDPDAPRGTFVHWVLYGIDPATTRIPERSDLQSEETADFRRTAAEGITDFGGLGYGGPCPPSGTHRYFFKLYALDTDFDFEKAPTKADVEGAVNGHILAQAEFVGTYARER